jgi:hypothetical protein
LLYFSGEEIRDILAARFDREEKIIKESNEKLKEEFSKI